jgi:hypothetical protein
MLWLCVILTVGIVGAVLARIWARKIDLPPPAGFTLADLRRLKQEGKMSEEEFEKTSKLVSKAHSAQFIPPANKEPPDPKVR